MKKVILFCTLLAFSSALLAEPHPPDKKSTPAPKPTPANAGSVEASKPEPPKVTKQEVKKPTTGHKPGVYERTWVEREIPVEIAGKPRIAYLLANTVFEVEGRIVPGFYWKRPGGNKFLEFDGKSFEQVAGDAQLWSSDVTPKMMAAGHAAGELGIVMPPDVELAQCLDNPANWKDDEVRDGDTFAFGVEASPAKDTPGLRNEVQHPGHGPDDDFGVYLNPVASFSGKKVLARSCTLRWEAGGYQFEREVVIAKSCFNAPLVRNVRRTPKQAAPVAESKPAPPHEEQGELTVPPGKPGTADYVPVVETHEKFDARSEGFSWGGHLFTSASTGAEVDSKGNLKTGSMKFIQYDARADMYWVKQLSGDPRNDRTYFRFYGALGYRFFTNPGESSDEEAGAGGGPDIEAKAELVSRIGDNQDVSGSVDGIWNSNSNGSRTGAQVALETHPREGRGLGGSLSYTDTSTGIKEGIDVDGRFLDARVTYQLQKDGKRTPLPGGGHTTLYLGYDDQDYTSSAWSSHQRGPKLGVQVLVPFNRWRDCGEGVECQVSPFAFLEAYGQNTHVTGKDALGNVIVDDTVPQFHVFAGFRLEF